jgi:hypothetical protein
MPPLNILTLVRFAGVKKCQVTKYRVPWNLAREGETLDWRGNGGFFMQPWRSRWGSPVCH